MSVARMNNILAEMIEKVLGSDKEDGGDIIKHLMFNT